MKGLIKILFYSLIFNVLLAILCAIQQTLIERNLVIIFATSLICVAIFRLTKIKKLSLESVIFFQCLFMGSGIFLLGKFWLISHQDVYEYFFLFIYFITILTINSQFDNERLLKSSQK